jgi:hypothetical protein
MQTLGESIAVIDRAAASIERCSSKGVTGLGEQINRGRGITDFRRGELAGKNLMVFVDRKMRVCARSGLRYPTQCEF